MVLIGIDPYPYENLYSVASSFLLSLYPKQYSHDMTPFFVASNPTNGASNGSDSFNIHVRRKSWSWLCQAVHWGSHEDPWLVITMSYILHILMHPIHIIYIHIYTIVIVYNHFTLYPIIVIVANNHGNPLSMDGKLANNHGKLYILNPMIRSTLVIISVRSPCNSWWPCGNAFRGTLDGLPWGN